jgi:hypothetical protein
LHQSNHFLGKVAVTNIFKNALNLADVALSPPFAAEHSACRLK